MKKLIPLFAIGCIAAGSASAQTTLYDTDFTSADGFTEAAVINGVDGWVAQNVTGSAIQSYNVASNGEVRFDANFLRGYNAATTFSVGDTITITSDLKSIGGTTPGFDANLFQIGLTDSTNLASTGVRAGLNFGGGSTGANWNMAFTSPTGADNDTGIALNSGYNTLVTTITKTATTNEFIVTGSLGGFDLGSTTITNSALYGATTVYTLIFSQGQSNTGGVALDSLNVTSVPEPGTYAMLAGLTALAFVMVRRRS